MTAKTNIRYRVGADVGLNSLGSSAIQLDANGNPTALLKTLSYIHDGGVDPTQNKSGTTRKAMAGIARRTRNMRKRRRHRLNQLDRQLYQLGYPVDDVPESEHGLYEYWNVRSALATAYVPDKDKRDRMMVRLSDISHAIAVGATPIVVSKPCSRMWSRPTSTRI